MWSKTRRYFLKIFFLSLELLFSTYLLADELPDLGSHERTLFTQIQEQKIGKTYMAYLRSSGRVIDDAIDEEYINDLGKKLVGASGVRGDHFYFFFFNSSAINSFAGPDGYVAVYSGLMLATQNEDELSAVMAHEIAHVTQGHIARKMADASNEKYQTIAGMLAAIALGTVSGQAAEAAIATTAASVQQRALNFSRQMEAEADRVGIMTLFNANFDPKSMPAFFTRLQQDERYYMKMPELLSDHPLTPERISDAENRAFQLPAKHHTTSQTYYLVKERLRVLSDNNPHHLITFYEQLLKSSKPLPHREALEYGYALSLQNNQAFAQAQSIMDKLSKTYPKQIIFPLGVADIATDAGDTKTAVSIMEHLYALYPDNYPVVLQYTYALYQDKAYQQALRILHRFHLDYPNQPVPYGLLSQIQGKAGLLADAYQTRATYLANYGALPAALGQLQIAMKLPNLDKTTKDKIEAQMSSIQAEMVQERG